MLRFVAGWKYRREILAPVSTSRAVQSFGNKKLRPRAKTPDLVQLIFYLHLVIVLKTPDAAHVQFYPPLRNARH
ncbi:MAG TPA: hypothetical protein VFE89_13030, partial [Beijerinckiaceae bacterium]|nr:hypothetical protein [Beijerinckiaceae bacterium]